MTVYAVVGCARIGSRRAVGGSNVVNVNVDPIEALLGGVEVIVLATPREPISLCVVKDAINQVPLKT
jgi:hypothetical protein